MSIDRILRGKDPSRSRVSDFFAHAIYLDREETSSGDVDAVSTSEVSDGCTDSSLQLQNAQVALALFICADRLLVGNDFHLQFMIFDDTFDGFQVEPDVVCVEILEL